MNSLAYTLLASGLLSLSLSASAQPDKLPKDSRNGAYQQAMQAYRNGHFQQAFSELIRLADRGHIESRFRLGLMLHQGRGAPQNYRQAMRWYRAAANNGHAGAQNNLGVIYRDGDGVRKNRIQAYMWFSLAASQINPKAQGNRDALTLDMRNDEVLQAQQLTAEYMAKLWRKNRQSNLNKPSNKGFDVQLGLFTQAGNIERLRLRLTDLGIKLDNQPVLINGQSYHRLRVGPFATESQAEQVAQRMDQLFKLKSAVTSSE